MDDGDHAWVMAADGLRGSKGECHVSEMLVKCRGDFEQALRTC